MKSYHPNGKLESSVEWKKEKRDGPFELFYQDGSVRERGVFTNDVSKTTERFTRSREKLALEPCLVVDTDKPRVAIPQDVVLHVDSYHDKRTHLGWVFGYRLVGKEWKEAFRQTRGDDLESRATREIPISTKELPPGEWRFAVTSTAAGPDKFTETRSKTIRIEPSPAGGGNDLPKYKGVEIESSR